MGTTITISFPPGSVSQPVTITVGLTTSQPISAGFQFLGQTFVIEARAADGTAVTSFSQPFTIIIHYSDADVLGLDESSLTLDYWEVGTSQWITVPTTVDTEANTLTAVLDHLTVFAILGRSGYSLYLPLILLGGSEEKLYLPIILGPD